MDRRKENLSPTDELSETAMNSSMNSGDTTSTRREVSTASGESERCTIIILPTTPSKFHVQEITLVISETITKEHTDILQQPMQHGNILVSQTRGPLAGILIVQLLETAIKVTFQNLAIAASSLKEGQSMTMACECTSVFTIIEDILCSANIQFITFRLCRGKASLTYGTTTRGIPVDEIRRLEVLVKKIGSYKDAISNLLSRTTGDIMRTGRAEAAASHVVALSDPEFLTELNELRYQHQQSDKELNAMKDKLCGNASHRVIQNGADNHSYTEIVQPLQEQQNSEESASSSRLTSHPVFRRYPLLTLLRCIAERLLLRDWVNLRDHISKYVPLRALENTQNGIKLFEELIDRNLISDGNFDFIRNAFYEIQRIDVVHLIDCVQDGDYRLLTEQQPGRSGSRDTAVPNGLPAPPRQQMRDLTLGGAPEAIYDSNYTRRSPHAATNGDSRDERDSSVLQRKYRDVPGGSQLSSSYHAQENDNTTTTTAESSTSHESTATDSDSRRTEQASGPDSDTLTRNRDSENLNSEPANSRGVSSEGAHSEGAQSGGATAWVENPEWSCEHYDRYCDVQFSCCDNRFWPCHRCHNANSSCSTRKLRSRDIKKLKCKRCGKIQEFPKNSAHCVECNIKFSDYFCPICQHLTGTVNYPFHCEKCGICRIHGDRSFHCDVCGVCLDINLQGNHRCREGSAHDECCICFEDAFTGCQILPCSHKVHKDCAAMMLRNGITKCPICRESFAHRIERRPTP